MFARRKGIGYGIYVWTRARSLCTQSIIIIIIMNVKLKYIEIVQYLNLEYSE